MTASRQLVRVLLGTTSDQFVTVAAAPDTTTASFCADAFKALIKRGVQATDKTHRLVLRSKNGAIGLEKQVLLENFPTDGQAAIKELHLDLLPTDKRPTSPARAASPARALGDAAVPTAGSAPSSVIVTGATLGSPPIQPVLPPATASPLLGPALLASVPAATAAAAVSVAAIGSPAVSAASPDLRSSLTGVSGLEPLSPGASSGGDLSDSDADSADSDSDGEPPELPPDLPSGQGAAAAADGGSGAPATAVVPVAEIAGAAGTAAAGAEAVGAGGSAAAAAAPAPASSPASVRLSVSGVAVGVGGSGGSGVSKPMIPLSDALELSLQSLREQRRRAIEEINRHYDALEEAKRAEFAMLVLEGRSAVSRKSVAVSPYLDVGGVGIGGGDRVRSETRSRAGASLSHRPSAVTAATGGAPAAQSGSAASSLAVPAAAAASGSSPRGSLIAGALAAGGASAAASAASASTSTASAAPAAAAGSSSSTAAPAASAESKPFAAAPSSASSSATSATAASAVSSTRPTMDRASSMPVIGKLESKASRRDLTTFREESYRCIKINERGRRQNRTLRLTNLGIQNVRGNVVSAEHSYNEVFCVTLQDHQTLVISFVSDHDFTYVTPVAMQIVHEINNRISARRAQDQKNFTANLTAIPQKYQEKLHKRSKSQMHTERKLRAMAKTGGAGAGAGAGAGGTDSSISSIAEEDDAPGAASPRAASPVAAATAAAAGGEDGKVGEAGAAAAGGGGSGGASSAPALELSSEHRTKLINEQLKPLLHTPDGATAGSPQAASAASASAAKARQAAKLQALTGTTQDQRMQEIIDRIVLDPSTEEGRARSRFIKNMVVLEKDPSTMLGVVRQFMDSLQLYIEQKRTDEIKRMQGPGDKDNTALIGQSMERCVIMPVYQRLLATQKKLTSKKDDEITAKLNVLRQKDQVFFGVKADEVSSTNWSSAVYEMSAMDKKTLPSEKLQVLLKTARAIYNTYNYEKNVRKAEKALKNLKAGESPQAAIKPENYFLAADEFFPIFVYVVTNANIEAHETTKQYMWSLCSKNSLIGEGGYYLTCFDAAVEYIRTLQLDGAGDRIPDGREGRQARRWRRWRWYRR